MAQEWLVDGYNLLHAFSRGKSRQKKGRDALLSALSGFASLKDLPMLVVLDGSGDEADLEPVRTPLFRVVYSQKVSADAFIERRLYESGQTKFTVITDDRAITDIARGKGACVLKTGEMMRLMEEASRESSEKLQQDRIRSHGFNRPFDDKLKDL